MRFPCKCSATNFFRFFKKLYLPILVISLYCNSKVFNFLSTTTTCEGERSFNWLRFTFRLSKTFSHPLKSISLRLAMPAFSKVTETRSLDSRTSGSVNFTWNPLVTRSVKSFIPEGGVYWRVLLLFRWRLKNMTLFSKSIKTLLMVAVIFSLSKQGPLSKSSVSSKLQTFVFSMLTFTTRIPRLKVSRGMCCGTSTESKTSRTWTLCNLESKPENHSPGCEVFKIHLWASPNGLHVSQRHKTKEHRKRGIVSCRSFGIRSMTGSVKIWDDNSSR